ncbi:outer membrane efflux family protein [Psychromonas ingrahamii 37]|uniref:Outer membrane efflux family protein n=1 Tax=Psychromonas ingrahamii (strain DSM 17664 / CCUG 51855 / 37) TaxID=357804 RepID=A1SVJ7_PSYIN|nr:hypothetical protein [Psychromonas ingrahamii]ABM03512.1 outer membrane efflux family protein [Psychromonas ingrahamii 37]
MEQRQLDQKIVGIEVESAVVTYRQTLYSAFKEVDNVLSARQHYQYETARAVERIYASQYRHGAVSIQTWLDAKETQRNAEQSLLVNRYNQFSTQATIYQALGGSNIAARLSAEKVR